VLTTCLLLLSTATWAQEAPEPAPAEAPETEAPAGETAEEAPSETPAEPTGANPPPWEAGGPPPPEANQPPPPMRRTQQRHSSQRQKKMPRCESWEIAVWNPRKTGCAAQPDATGDDWCPVPEGMTPVQPVGDTNKWWVKRCADEPVEG
jgi:hypothetical protein